MRPIKAHPDPEGDDYRARIANLTEAQRKAQDILAKGTKGRERLLQDIREGLITAMYLEQAAGERPLDAGKSTEGNARQSRKQYKELAELVMDVTAELGD